ncbi:MAG: BrnT family toxin [Verrucomicrobiae bacterium]|nr:BrnT family toxin [Verrucomicrobiae bacterium]
MELEFDWINPPFDLKKTFLPREVQESFEDPFSLRLAPDASAFGGQARYFCLGKTLEGKGVLSIYRTNGKFARVICARPFSEEETHFYERKKEQNL